MESDKSIEADGSMPITQDDWVTKVLPAIVRRVRRWSAGWAYQPNVRWWEKGG